MACPAINSGYSKSCRDAQGGIKKFYVTEKANISSYTVVSGVVTAITMAGGRKFWLYEQELNTASTVEAPTTNRQNGSFFVDQTLNAVFNKRSAASSYQFKTLAVNDLVFISQEQTGTNFVFGLVNGMSMDPSTSPSGTAAGDRNGYEFVFKGNEPDFAPTISDVLLSGII